ncbi:MULTISPECIES: SSI family serine proteinase inhibitor [unclassified Crossiella]|uniref:SSI family serine proteinase inhibitor n=1 Tax=unclassified Crossiella TaxID=2620835 RepID=UPI001FFFEE7B|nr:MULTISPECIES: SSI family serine proteinase inhibitor [unclassified Crossiella]MCK2241111.1 SSI family serine proteinase inhibitor [Crossiella sp. S99.2]MCK2253745.1 SSI family serine proteinase inhibitor [Crossiella sp. S99.1]
MTTVTVRRNHCIRIHHGGRNRLPQTDSFLERRTMSRKRLLPLALGLAATLLPLAVVTAPTATATTATPRAASWLVLTSNPGEAPTRDARSRTLTCEPAAGAHPQPAWSCHELKKAGGDFHQVNVGPQEPCYLIYAPITVTARGMWNGRPVTYQETFPNDCVLYQEKGPLFRF